MRVSIMSAGLVLGLGLVAGQALAADYVPTPPTVDVSASAQAHQGPNVAVALVRNINGAEVSNVANAGGAASSDGDNTAVEGRANMVGSYGTAEAYALADLTTGTLKAAVMSNGANHFGTPGGDARAYFGDTVHFNNTTDQAVALALSFAFEGSINSPDGGASGGYSYFSLSGCGGCGDIVFAGDGKGIGNVIQAEFDKLGIYSLHDYYGAVPYGSSAHWQVDPFGLIGARMSTVLFIPPGQSSLGIGAALSISCRGGDTCDFGHTGKFAFGDLADGLSWTSESGVFLTGLPQTGGVPEPGVWALMIAGFGLAGSALRRRRVTVRI